MSYDLSPLWLTFKLAAVTTGVLILLGIPLAYWLAFSERKIKSVVEALVSLPLVLPPTVLGFYLLLTFSPAHFIGRFLETYFNARVVFTFAGLVIGSIVFSLPFMVNPVKAGFQSFPIHLIEIARTLGKSQLEILRKVVLPNIRPSLLTGIVMSFAHTVGEFGVVLMIGGSIPGKTKTASIAVYEEVEKMNYASASFYSLVLVIICFSVLFVLYRSNEKSWEYS